MTVKKIETLWSSYRFNNCDTCKKDDCKGRLDYDNLCSNLNYLREYGQKNHEKNAETFVELKKIMDRDEPTIFSFGCGLGLDYIGAVESFGEGVKYIPIEECEWAITKTEPFQNFRPKLPRNSFGFKEAMHLLRVPIKSVVLCFFNSLFTISENTDLKEMLINLLGNKNTFYLVCNYTINNNFHLPSTEMKFIESLRRRLGDKFSFKKHEVLGGDGIILKGVRK